MGNAQRNSKNLLRHVLTVAGVLACALVALSASAATQAGKASPSDKPADKPDKPADKPDPCIRYWGEPRNTGYGYYHIVHIANSCDVDYACSVSTDVNPAPVNVIVGAKKEVEVNTYLGSPSSVFTPHVTCAQKK